MTTTEKYDTLIEVFDREKAKAIAGYLDEKNEELLTKTEFYKAMNEFELKLTGKMIDFERGLNTKLWGAFITVVLLLAGLYFKK